MRANIKYPEYPNTRAFELSSRAIVPIYIYDNTSSKK